MKQNEYMETDKNIQNILNRLISEEWIASVMYRQFVVGVCCSEERRQIKDLMLEISEDEMDDHYEKLVAFAEKNGYSAPCQIKDYEKYAGKETVKQFQSWKKD